jgi:hypothetical protein
MRAASWLALSLVAGCRTPPWDELVPRDLASAQQGPIDLSAPDLSAPDLAMEDLAVRDFAVAAADLSAPMDLATSDLFVCGHTREEVSVFDINVLGVGFRAHVWRGTMGCGPARLVPRVVVVPTTQLTAANLDITDEVGGIADSVALAGPAMSTCAPAALGAACDRDCQCQAVDLEAICTGVSVVSWVCARSCSSDTECPPALPQCASSNGFRCGSTACRTASDCAPWQVIESCACRPPPALPDGHCGCGDDCAAGLCTMDGTCILPCTVYADCPSTSRCAAGACVS